MNPVKSILLEGSLYGEPYRKNDSVSFVVTGKRTYRTAEGTFEEETTFFNVTCSGENHCRMILDNFREGKYIRVTGPVKEIPATDADGGRYNHICVFAEHIGFTPVMERNKNSHSRRLPSEGPER